MMKLSFLIEAVDRVSAPVRKINRLINSIAAPARRVRESIASIGRESGLQRIMAAAGGVRERFGGLMRDLRGLRTGLLYVTGAVVGMLYPLKRSIDELSEVNDIAASFGISARDLQRLTAALTLDGSSIRDAAQSLKFLQQNAVAAVTGSEEMATWFARAGISVEFLEKNLKDPKALLYALADGLKRNETPAKRLTLSNQLLGKSSARVVQTLSRGAGELERVGDRAEALGQVLDNKTVAAMDDAGDSIHDMQRTLGGLMAVIAAASLPVIKAITQRITGWAQANRALIATRATEFFEGLLARLPAIVEGITDLVTAVSGIARVLNGVARLFGGWGNVLVIVASVIAGKMLWSIIMLTKAVLGLGGAMALTPLGWFLVAVAAIGLAAYQIYKHWEPIKEFFKSLWNGIAAAFDNGLNWIGDKIKAVVELAKNLAVTLDNVVPDWIKRFALPWNAVKFIADSARVSGAPVATAVPTGRNRFGGEIHLKIDAGGTRTRVTKLASDNNDVAIDVDTGMSIVSP